MTSVEGDSIFFIQFYPVALFAGARRALLNNNIIV